MGVVTAHGVSLNAETRARLTGMIRKKPAPDLIRGGCRFSDKIMRH